MSLNKLTVVFCVFSFLIISSQSMAIDIDTEVGFENRYFFSEGILGQEKFHTSIRAEFGTDYAQDDTQYELLLFARYDLEDENRTHADIRELSWLYYRDLWEVKVGVSKVFWGVTESQNLVDIVNQSDSVEGIDNDAKLGQPMVKLSSQYSFGNIDILWLPYFRERTFNSRDGRFIQPIQIDYKHSQYESSAEEWHSDAAVRFSYNSGNFLLAVSHFTGTSREPYFLFNDNPANPKLIPYYPVIDQTGLEIQYIYCGTLLKLESITRSGFGERYTAATSGFEYTQIGLLDTRFDLGWIVEYLFDDRKELSTNPFEQDIFFGWRFVTNDADSSEVLAGVIVDPETNETVFSIEASRRLFSNLKVTLEAMIFSGTDAAKSNTSDILASLTSPNPKVKTAFLQDEDYIQFEMIFYF